MSRFAGNLSTVIGERSGRHHLAMAVFLCLLEVTLILQVEMLIIHLLMALAMFGRDVIDAVMHADEE